jgi:hypothetical protein
MSKDLKYEISITWGSLLISLAGLCNQHFYSSRMQLCYAKNFTGVSSTNKIILNLYLMKNVINVTCYIDLK